jgi:hypothetical protein
VELGGDEEEEDDGEEESGTFEGVEDALGCSPVAAAGGEKAGVASPIGTMPILLIRICKRWRSSTADEHHEESAYRVCYLYTSQTCRFLPHSSPSRAYPHYLSSPSNPSVLPLKDSGPVRGQAARGGSSID